MDKMRTKTAIIILMALIAVSCSFLDRNSYTQIPIEDYFTEEQDFRLATIGAYEAMTTNVVGGAQTSSVSGGTYFCGLPVIMNVPSDELLCYNNAAEAYGQFTQVINCSFNETNTGYRRMWDAFFAGINRCNSVICNAYKVESKNVDMYVAEARFLRGLYYWYLAQTFGGVPLVKYRGEGNEPRSSLEDVYTDILDDMRHAYGVLPKEKGKGAHGDGSATKYTAAAYIGRICNYLAACKRTGAASELVAEQPLNDFSWVDAEKMSEEAYNCLKDVVDNSPYVLIDDFTNLFRETTKDDQHKECLLMAEYYLEGTEGQFPSTRMFALSPGCSGTEESGQTGAVNARYAMPTPKIFGFFSPLDPRRDWFCAGTAAGSVKAGTLIEEKASDGYIYVKPFKRSGTAGSKTWSADNDSRVDSPTQTYMPFLDPVNASVGKFRFVQAGQISTHTKDRHGLSFPLMRMADVYLMYAEAIYFHTDNQDLAREQMRKVLYRACAKDDQLTDYLMSKYRKDDFVEELLESRERELCFEGTRKYDLFRFNLLDKTMKDLVNTPIHTEGNENYYAWSSFFQYETGRFVGIKVSNAKYFAPCAESIKNNWKPYKMWAPISSLQIAANPALEQNAKW